MSLLAASSHPTLSVDVSVTSKMILLLACLLSCLPQLLRGENQLCYLDDVQRTRGICKDIKDCQFAIDSLRAGIQPTTCQGRVVCCPTEPTLSEKKCAEYTDYLRIPLSLSLSASRHPDPITCIVPPGTFIAGGRDAQLYEFPHVAALGWGRSPKGLKFHCTGTLISEKYVLTAAHCITSQHGPPSYVLLGDIALPEERAADFRQVIPIAQTIMHPEYKPPLTYNDIALLKLATPVALSQYMLPACLPRPGDKGYEVEAVGFGLLGPGEPQTNILQAVNLSAYQRKECQTFYNAASDKDRRFPKGIINTQLCAGDKTGSGKDTCNGDSGGPLTINKQHRCVFHILGVTSFGARLCGYGQPAVFTKVASYVRWIESIVWGSQ